MEKPQSPIEIGTQSSNRSGGIQATPVNTNANDRVPVDKSLLINERELNRDEHIQNEGSRDESILDEGSRDERIQNEGSRVERILGGRSRNRGTAATPPPAPGLPNPFAPSHGIDTLESDYYGRPTMLPPAHRHNPTLGRRDSEFEHVPGWYGEEDPGPSQYTARNNSAPIARLSHLIHSQHWRESHEKGSLKYRRFISDNLSKPFEDRVKTFGTPDLFYATDNTDREFHVNLSSLQRINLHMLQEEVLHQITMLEKNGWPGSREGIRTALEHYGMSLWRIC